MKFFGSDTQTLENVARRKFHQNFTTNFTTPFGREKGEKIISHRTSAGGVVASEKVTTKKERAAATRPLDCKGQWVAEHLIPGVGSTLLWLFLTGTDATGGRAKPGRFGSLALAWNEKEVFWGRESSRIPAGKARKCGRLWVFACVPNPGEQSIWRQCPPSARKQSTKERPNRPVFTHVQMLPWVQMNSHYRYRLRA